MSEVRIDRGGRAVGAHDPGCRAGPSDHACWGYASDRERVSVASTWLADGLEAGQQAMYVGSGPVPALVEELAGIPDLARRLDTGEVRVASAADVYDLAAPVDAEEQLATYAAAVDAALAAGHRGLRVAADITPLVADPARRAAHLHWEQVADRYIVDHPFAPLCLYDTRQVQGLGAIAAVHPLQGPDEPEFWVVGTGPRTAGIGGEVDGFGAPALAEVLRTLPPTDVLDLEDLGFVDGRVAEVLHGELRRRQATGERLRLRGAGPSLRRVWDLCAFEPALLGP